jgi:thiol-disulfide isomerase/thioredoxin
MLHHGKTWLTAFVFGCGCVLLTGTPSSLRAAGGDKQDPKDVLLRKAEAVTKDDEKDTKLKSFHRKVYTVKLMQGKAYRINLDSKDFDTFLRLENSTGKEVAFNDDVKQGNLNSQIVYETPKTGEYRIIVTSFDGKVGDFVLEMRHATDAEAVEARLTNRINAFPESTPEEQKQLIAEVIKQFQQKGKDLTFNDARTAAGLAQMLDENDIKFTRDTLATFSKLFAAADDEKVAKLLPQFVDGLVKKLAIIGKELEISGKTTDDKDFDLKKLKGKVVLVDFWATWCGPCIQEIPNIVKAHEKYNSKGFEVIGISLDRNDEAIVKFLEARKLPWGSINVKDSRLLADRYEVNAIPAPFLIGRDGRVVSTRARGPQLERLLERLINEKK